MRINKGKAKVVIGISYPDVVAGTACSVVLRKIGVSPRQYGFARIGNDGGSISVKSKFGKTWVIHVVELLKVEGIKGTVSINGFRVIR